MNLQYMPDDGTPDHHQEVAIIYVRSSTTQQGTEGTTLETQTESCEELVRHRGYKLPPENLLIEMESAAFLERPVFEKLLTKVNNREVDVVVSHDPDRLTRDPRDSINILHTFQQAGVRLEFVHGPSDTSPEGQLLMYVLGFSAQKERLQFMERAERGKRAVARAGRMPATGGVGLYGYDYDPVQKCRVINEIEALVVRQMFQWAMDGFSTYRIACMLNEANIPSKTGKKWSQSRAKRTLQNVAYTGIQYYGKFRHRKVAGNKRIVTEKPISDAILVEGFTPRLICPDFWNEVQERIKTRPGRWSREGPHVPHDRVYQVLEVRSPRGRLDALPRSRYYRCTNTRHRAERLPSCDALYIRAHELETVCWDIITAAIRNPDTLAQQVHHLVETGEGDLGEEMQNWPGK